MMKIETSSEPATNRLLITYIYIYIYIWFARCHILSNEKMRREKKWRNLCKKISIFMKKQQQKKKKMSRRNEKRVPDRGHARSVVTSFTHHKKQRERWESDRGRELRELQLGALKLRNDCSYLFWKYGILAFCVSIISQECNKNR